jgi:hypothetical protein
LPEQVAFADPVPADESGPLALVVIAGWAFFFFFFLATWATGESVAPPDRESILMEVWWRTTGPPV